MDTDPRKTTIGEPQEAPCDVKTIEIVGETETTVDVEIDTEYIGVVGKPEHPEISILKH